MSTLVFPQFCDYFTSRLERFRHVFSRAATYNNFTTAAFTVVSSTERYGVTDSARMLCDGTNQEDGNRCYENTLRFFRVSDGYSHKDMSKELASVINDSGQVYKNEKRCFIVIDGHNAIHSGHYMPGVKKTVQHSESPSKPQHTFAHMWGVAGVLVGSKDTSISCLPIVGEIQQGESEIRKWRGEHDVAEMSHVEKMTKITEDLTETFGHSFLLADSYFFNSNVLRRIKKHNEIHNSDRSIVMISKAKKNCKAWTLPPERVEGTLGRPRIRGEEVKLWNLFESEKSSFKKEKMTLYGKEEEVSYLEKVLLWGDEYTKVKFVLTISSRGMAIFVCTDITVSAKTIIESYALRWKCECSFKIASQDTYAYDSHFWTKSMPRLNRYSKKDDPDPLTLVDEDKRGKIYKAFRGYERYAVVAFIAQDLLHLYTLKLASEGYISPTWLRTKTEKVISVRNLINDIHILFLCNFEAIRARLKPDKKKKDSSAIVK